jgi:hypothetical protein
VGFLEDRIKMLDLKISKAAKPAPGFEEGSVMLKQREAWSTSLGGFPLRVAMLVFCDCKECYREGTLQLLR